MGFLNKETQAWAFHVFLNISCVFFCFYTHTITFQALNEIETGLCYINASTIGAEIQLPFGGIKGTGNGHRDAGSSMIDNCTEWKSCMVDYSGKVQKAQIDH